MTNKRRLRPIVNTFALLALGILIGNLSTAEGSEVTKIIFAAFPSIFIGIFLVVAWVGSGGACCEGCMCGSDFNPMESTDE